MYETIVLGLACLVTPVLAKYAGHDGKKVPFDLVGIAGMFFLLSAASSLDLASKVGAIAGISQLVGTAAPLVGWLFLIVAALIGMVRGVTELVGHKLLHT